MERLNKLRVSINSDRLKVAFLMATVAMMAIDLIDSNLVARIHALHFYTNTFLQVKVAYLIIGTALTTTLTYLSTPKSL